MASTLFKLLFGLKKALEAVHYVPLREALPPGQLEKKVSLGKQYLCKGSILSHLLCVFQHTQVEITNKHMYMRKYTVYAIKQECKHIQNAREMCMT